MDTLDKTPTTTKMWVITRDMLKIASAITNESMFEMTYRLIKAEFERVTTGNILDHKVLKQALENDKGSQDTN